MTWTSAGALGVALAVALGAFGAHALKGRLDAYAMGIWEKAVFYQAIHALGLIVTPLLAKTGLATATGAAWACGLMLAGILLFSGSLYLLALTGARALGAVTPFGGAAFIAAWLVLAYAAAGRY
jgi:uncharacterized membrane protein YgdD (TMEM256/DUF423 family)